MVTIAGLDDSKYIDKVASASKTESNSAISITGETDRVYTPAKGPGYSVIVNEGGKQVFEIVRDNLDNVVVWNPWAEKANSMGDFEPKDGFKQMICVEAGQVSGWQKLEAGETFEGSQIIRSNL
jgi:glucose-6-phosphate 1-epimerase